MASQSETLARLWRRLAPWPGGSWVFSRIFGWFVPYSNTVGARILELAPGLCRVAMADRRRVRNHLRSIHAVALVNLGEQTSGLAMTVALPPGIRGIVTEIGAVYHKKARGNLLAVARATPPREVTDPVDHRVETVITDSAGEEVCRVHTIWRLARTSTAPAQ